MRFQNYSLQQHLCTFRGPKKVMISSFPDFNGKVHISANICTSETSSFIRISETYLKGFLKKPAKAHTSAGFPAAGKESAQQGRLPIKIENGEKYYVASCPAFDVAIRCYLTSTSIVNYPLIPPYLASMRVRYVVAGDF